MRERTDMTPDKMPLALTTPKAEQIARDARRAELLAASAEEKARRYRGALGDVWETLQAFVRMLRCYTRRQYTRAPWRSMVLVAAALLYFLAPVDLVPDFLLGGFVDDVGVLLAVLRQVRSDLDAFRAWERAGGAG